MENGTSLKMGTSANLGQNENEHQPCQGDRGDLDQKARLAVVLSGEMIVMMME
jgi:hypothetical protein